MRMSKQDQHLNGPNQDLLSKHIHHKVTMTATQRGWVLWNQTKHLVAQNQDDPRPMEPAIASPFESCMPLLSHGWFIRRGWLARKNKSCAIQLQATKKIILNSQIIAVRKDGEDGNMIKESVKILRKKLEEEKVPDKRAELQALIEVGRFMVESGPLVSTQEFIRQRKKNSFSVI